MSWLAGKDGKPAPGSGLCCALVGSKRRDFLFCSGKRAKSWRPRFRGEGTQSYSTEATRLLASRGLEWSSGLAGLQGIADGQRGASEQWPVT
ncbi:hypothetical protein QBC32DRAFT_329927 [Pseudoneurospora amorphoporcata]|uniref:Uncharacterized protein n=1 Tax=Pseudoneurospora amorphoporcata TaxID=241081 RepID=A0AAN6SKS5_9PEZI|nr:hypothetical protein QBC32DRAFT_329927 [Pseudoneurospora amorphoporcata]